MRCTAAALVVVGVAWAALVHLSVKRPAATDPVKQTRLERLFAAPAAVYIQSGWNPASRDPHPERGLPATRAFDFEAPDALDAWHPLLSMPPAHAHTLREGATVPPPAPARSAAEAAASGRQGLRFASASGGALCFFEVEPDTPYAFEALRRRGVNPLPRGEQDHAELLRDTLAGAVLLFELHESPDLEAHGGDATEAFFAAAQLTAARHVMDPPAEPARFETAVSRFRTHALTRALAVVLVGGHPGWWLWNDVAWDGPRPPDGAVDFDDLRLTRIPLRRYLPLEDTAEADELRAPQGDPLLRKVKILGDLRPACLAPPDSEIQIQFRLPVGPYQLEFAAGVLEERHQAWGRTPVQVVAELRTAIGAEVLVHRELQPAERRADCGWIEHVHGGVGQGEPATLVLRATSREPCEELVAFSEPILSAPRPGPRPPSVILISLDTLRADRLGCYGYRRPDGQPTSPHLDAFAAESLCFEQARSTAPYTLPSHASMFTGQFPRAHGVSQFGSRLSPAVHELLPVQFASAGYRTAAFTAGGFLSYENGFHHGFDRYSILDPFLTAEDPLRQQLPLAGQRAFNDAMFARHDRARIEDWIGAHDQQSFFLFVHSYLTHSYFPPRELAERFVTADPLGVVSSDRNVKLLDRESARLGTPPPPAAVATLEDLYDATVAAADAEVGALLRCLETLGLAGSTIVVITSDHGEEFGEHGGLLHGRSVYEEMMRVPLLVRIPGVAPRRVAQPVDLTDLAPTLLAAANLPRLRNTHGMDLRERVRRGQFRQPGFAEVDARMLTERYALYRGGYKLISNPETAVEEDAYQSRRPPRFELFDLRQDPFEQRNLLAPAGASARLLPVLRPELERILEKLDSDRRRWIPDDRHLRLPEGGGELARILSELGYFVGEESDQESDRER